MKTLIFAAVLFAATAAQAQSDPRMQPDTQLPYDPQMQNTMDDPNRPMRSDPGADPSAPVRTTPPIEPAAPRGSVRTQDYERPKRTELYIIPETGMEFGALNRGVYTSPLATRTNVGYWSGIASLSAGLRVKDVHLGLRYQGSYTGRDEFNELQFHKLYGELGFDWRRKIYVGSVFFDFGYSALRSTSVALNGLGGKAGIAFDIYIARWFSLGPMASFDVQGFDTGVPDPGHRRNVWVNTLGGTIMGRIGFHI